MPLQDAARRSRRAEPARQPSGDGPIERAAERPDGNRHRLHDPAAWARGQIGAQPIVGLTQFAEVLRGEIATRVDVVEQRGSCCDGAVCRAARAHRTRLLGAELPRLHGQGFALRPEPGQRPLVVGDDPLAAERQRRRRAAGPRELAKAIGAEQQCQLAAPPAFVEIDELRLAAPAGPRCAGPPALRACGALLRSRRARRLPRPPPAAPARHGDRVRPPACARRR